MKPKYAYVTLIALAVIALVAAAISYLRTANIPVLEPAGTIALGERTVMFDTLELCAIVVVPVFFLLFFFAWKYRAESPNARTEHSPDWDHDSMLAEVLWWLVPTIIIFFLGVIAWRSSHALDPYRPLPSDEPALEVQVVALDWKWLFIYPAQGIASVNLVEFPVGEPVHFELTADAPMNSFWVPQLAGQIMVMPGMTTQLYLSADRAGDFAGSSANISGDGFAGMTFTARAVSQDEFNAWVQATQASSTPLSEATYHSFAAPSEYVAPATFAPIQGGLYDSIVGSYMAPMQMQMQNTSTP